MAVQSANFKTTDVDISRVYDETFREYMIGIAKLFKEDNITPSQHSAFHIGENLREFGPQHSRGAQFYERYIHLLQRQNTNLKFGEMEATFMNSTARAANLKAILTDNAEIRSHASEAIKTFERVTNQDSRGFRLAQMLDPEDTHFDLEARSQWGVLSIEERQLLQDYLSWRYGDFDLESWTASGSIMDQISINGVRYARKNVLKHDQDSHIIFDVPGTNETAPGEIINIFQYWHTTPADVEIKAIYLIVNRFNPHPTLDREDPYRKFPLIVGYLCAIKPMETRVIEAGHVRSHFGLTPIKHNGQDLMHVLPMSRVEQGHLWLNTVKDAPEDSEEESEDSIDSEEDAVEEDAFLQDEYSDDE
ncbi:hypothetical protein B0H19DRAFT_1259646 [Mycena capillaripes]|nr:hypothetical protein B0H19DRAFT_1259646 [Mycena capillaripes]